MKKLKQRSRSSLLLIAGLFLCIGGCGTMPYPQYLAVVDNVDPIVRYTAQHMTTVDPDVAMALIVDIADKLADSRPGSWDQYMEFVNGRLWQAENFRISEQIDRQATARESAIVAAFFAEYMEFGKQCRMYPFAMVGEKLDITISRLRTEVQRLTMPSKLPEPRPEPPFPAIDEVP